MNRSIRSMGSGFYISKTVGIVGILVGVAALSTIIALSVVYSQEKSRNTQVSPTNGGTTATSTTPTPTPSNKPWDQYRLPKSLVPDHYTVTLWPRLEPDSNTGLYIFTGHSVVKFKCVEDTDLILIHSNKLNFTRQENQQLAMLTSTSGAAPVPSIRTSWLQTVTQYLVLELDAKLVKDQSYQLYTEFTGELADDLGGFYRSEYTENNVTRVVATTQMQPTDARKAFPCFDEPAMKARFNITLIHDHGTVALSNGMEIETINITIGDQHVLQTVFEQTEKMSTYLLAFIVSDFSFINSTIDGVLVRIFARRAAIDANQGDYALNKTGPILKFFEEYYNSTYPLPKSDQIALPDFNAGAMENWGLITYRETALLYGKDFSSNSNQERITTIIGHELAHMWFGNLVTLRWWNDLWLNEGFASYVEYLGADKAEPDWNVKDLIVLNDIHRVFAVDALTSSHPLSSNEEDIQKPAQISELFDAISYSKGASVLRMLSDFLSEDVFKQGLQTYLREFAFETAVYTDLWKHLQQAVTDTHTSLPSKVDEIMNTWVLQMGFPVVTINTTAGTVSQQHFLLDSNAVVTTQSKFNYQWIVPIRWMKTKAPQNIFWLQEKSVSVEDMKVGGADWVLANLHVVGYYRVNYDQNNWERLLGVLSTDHKAIPMINRAQLVDDAFNLARAKIISTVLALRTTKYLKNEREYMPWKSALNNLEFFYLMFDRSEVFGVMQAYLENQVTDLFTYYKNITDNWSKVPDGHMDQYNQVNAISLACRTGLDDCLSLATHWFKQWMDTGTNVIHPNLRSTVYCNAIAAGGAEEWDFAWRKFQSASIASEADKLRAALACAKQPWLLNRYLEYTLKPKLIRKQDATSTIVYIARNVIGQSLAWDFIRANWPYIFREYGGGSFSFSNLINGVTERFSTEFELQQLKQFQLDNADVGFGSGTLALQQSIERTQANIRWRLENQEMVLNWFTAEGKS
ncbi:alanyl (membrane) aminopeptidase b, tandem duplicate 1 [Nothobranchius furzeri]|uniref:alanyl (membrane) aminopeptidase b, tandem duplicate 1 n=1 Tax=Nothobranchius furzeri TaxID=105023 RepID=UPI00077D3D3A